MATTDSKSEKVLEVSTDANKSAADLEAEIAAAASAISSLETVGGETVKKEVTRKKRTKKATTKSTSTKKTSKKSTAKKSGTSSEKKTTATKKAPAKKQAAKKSPSKSKSKPSMTDVMPVKPEKTPKVIKKAEVQSEESSGPSAVKVTVQPKPATRESGDDEPKETPTVILSHKGRSLTPLSDVSKPEPTRKSGAKKPEPAKQDVIKPLFDEPESVEEVPTKEAPKAVTSSVRVSKQPIHTEKPYGVITGPAKEPSAVAHASAPSRVANKTELHRHKDKHTPHVARIYDTRTYHIPISVDHHHRRAILPLWGQIVVLLIGLVAMIVIGRATGLVEF